MDFDTEQAILLENKIRKPLCIILWTSGDVIWFVRELIEPHLKRFEDRRLAGVLRKLADKKRLTAWEKKYHDPKTLRTLAVELDEGNL